MVPIRLDTGDFGDAVARLHEGLRKQGFQVSPEEEKRKFFGPSTNEAVRTYQREHKLPVTGVVDAATHAVLETAMSASVTELPDIQISQKATDVSLSDGGNRPTRESTTGVDQVAPMPAGRFVVRGRVVQADGKPLTGARVHAYDKDLRHEQPLGQANLEPDGYEIYYTAAQFRRAEKGSADLFLVVFDADEQEIVRSEVVFNARQEETIDLTVPGGEPALSEFDQILREIQSLLEGQGDSGEDLPVGQLNDSDITFLTNDTGIARERIAWFVQAVKFALETAQLDADLTSLKSFRAPVPEGLVPHIPPEAFYGWFRTGYDLVTLWSHTTDELIAGLKMAIFQNIIPQDIGSQFEKIAERVNILKAGQLLKPADNGQPGSLGDLLGTIPQRLSPEKELIVASVVRDYGAANDMLAERLKQANFDDREIASVQVSQALGDLTLNHTPLVQALQTLRQVEDSASLHFLAAQSPVQWAKLVYEHGIPASAVSQEIYVAQLERAVEAKYPTAVFAARVQDNLIPLYDPAIKAAANFLVANPTLELMQHNVRAYVNNGADMGDVADPEELVNTLQRIQRVQKLSTTWQEAGVLLNNNLDSGLAIVQQGPDNFIAAVQQDISRERAQDLFTTAQNTHDTTMAVLGTTLTGILPGVFVITTPDKPVTEHPGLKNYPNLRELFGNLDACQCDHCQSVLSPAAYLVDSMNFLDPKTGANALSVLFKRRPDIGDLELTCANTNTELPYIDLVLEILENAVALPLEIPSPYDDLRPEIDLRMPLTDSAAQSLRSVLGRTAISIGEHLEVKQHDIVGHGLDSPHTDFVVSDGTHHWVLRYWVESFTKTPSPTSPTSPNIRLNVTDFNQAITALNQGTVPQTSWLVPPPSYLGDKTNNLPLSGTPLVTPLQPNSTWKVQYKRSVYVTVELPDPPQIGVRIEGLGTITLKSEQGQDLEALLAMGSQIRAVRNMLETQNGKNEPQALIEPLRGLLPTEFGYHVIKLVGNPPDAKITEWRIEARIEVIPTYVPQKLVIASLTYQCLETHSDLKASPENQNPEAYKRLDADTVVYPWSLPFNLWLGEVRVFMERRGIPRRQLMEDFNPTNRLGTDPTADAIAREVLGLSKSEADIIAHASALPPEPWRYWGLQENNNSVEDLNDGSKATGSWIEVLARVSILLQRSGLTYRELLNVLETRFLKSISPNLVPTGNNCNTSQMSLQGLQPTHLDRIQRLVRLWRTLDWALFDLDLAIAAVTNNNTMDLSQDTLRGLSHIQRLHELLGLPVRVIASWQDTLITATYTDHISDKQTTTRSIYEQLFQNAALQNPPDPDFALKMVQLPKPTKTLAEKASVIMAAFGMNAPDLTSLMNSSAVIVPITTGTQMPWLSLDYLASLYRHITLAKALHLTIDDYLRALTLIDNAPFQSFKQLIEFVEAVQFIRGNRFAFTFEEIEYLLNYKKDKTQDKATLLFSPAWAEQTLTDLRTRLQTVQREVLSSTELPAEHLSKMLARLGWYPTLIEEAVSLFETDMQFEAPISARKMPLAVTIPPTLADKVSYQIINRSPIFTADDIVDVPALITQLQNDTNPSTGPVSTYMWGLFEDTAKQVLSDQNSTALQRQSALLQQLNTVLQGRSIYVPTRFAGVSLRSETQSLIAQNPTGESLMRLNRFLLEDAYPTQITIKPRESKLIASGIVKQDDWVSWLAVNTTDADVTAAIKSLKSEVDAFEYRLQSFDLPIFRVAYATPLTIPREMSSRCFYDQNTQEIAFIGWITDQERLQFTDALPDAELQALQKKSDNYCEQAEENLFLSMNDLEMLFEPGYLPNARFDFVLEKLLSWFYLDAAVDSLSSSLVLEQTIVHDLLVKQLEQAQTLKVLRSTAFINSDSRVAITVSSFTAQVQALCKLHKAALICTRLKLKRSELSWLPAKQLQANANNVFKTVVFDNLPFDAQVTVANPVTFEDFVGLLQLFELRDKPQVGADLMAKLLTVDDEEELKTDIAEALQLKLPNVTEQLKSQDVTEAITQLHLTWRDDYFKPASIFALMGLLLTLQRLGGSTSKMLSLTTETPGVGEAALARNLLRSRYDASAWPEQLKAIVDLLREKQRAALVAYLVARDNLRDANDLYDRYLIDVEMSACKTSTRILHAISAVQLFVQRCLMHLESEVNDDGVEIGVSPSQIDNGSWKWMKNYRVWEANRKVFLYPENWIEPELRDDKSEIFKELEGQLLQDELDDERAEEILKDYLKQLEGISRLAIIGMYVEKPTRLCIISGIETTCPTGETIVHIVGRTRNNPARFFYRRWILSATVNHWTSWERVPLDGVKNDHILPFILRGEAYIAWPEITQLAAAPGTGIDDDKSPGAKWRIQMSWIRRTSRGWSDRFMSADTLEHPWIPGKDANETFTFRVQREQSTAKGATSIVIDCLGARDPDNGNVKFSTKPENPNREKPQPLDDIRDRSHPDPGLTVTITGKIAASYKEGTNTIYRYIHGAIVKCSLVIESSEAIEYFNNEYLWEEANWPSPTPGIHNAYAQPYITQTLGATGSNGDFSIVMNLRARAMYLDKVLNSNPSPHFSLEVIGIPTIDDDPAPISLPLPANIDFPDDPKKVAWLDVTFHQNFEIPRSGKAPGTNAERSLPMDRIKQFELLDAEDAKFEPVPSLLLTPPDKATAHASGYLMPNAHGSEFQLLNPAPPYNLIPVWEGVAERYFWLPSFPADELTPSDGMTESLCYLPPEVIAYIDQDSTYFIRFISNNETLEYKPHPQSEVSITQNSTNFIGGKSSSNPAYEIQLDGHPRASYLRLILAQGDKQPLFSLVEQEWTDPQDFDGHTAENVIDTRLSFTRPAIRFEPDQARSPYAVYNTELFFHVPFLIATNLSHNQRFEEAQQWFHLIFDPTTNDPEKSVKRYWRYLPFRDHSQTTPIDQLMKLLTDPTVPDSDTDKIAVNTQIVAWLENPFRPHAVARLRPRAYEFAVVFKYLDNLITWGDQLFRQSTTESINEATQLYILAAKLLGARPQNLPRTTQVPALTYRTANHWDQFSNAWVELEANLTLVARAKQTVHKKMGLNILTSIGMPYFCIPGNEKMLTYWDTVVDRLFKIRHCLNIEGVEQQIPLFQPPIDPGLLVRAVAAGLDISSVVADMNMPMPFYRFNVLVQKASELCGELKALGGALLSALEKKDAEQLSLLRSGHEIDLLNLVTEVKQQQIEEARTNLEALHQSEKLASIRFLQYQRLLGKTDTTISDDPNAEVEQSSMIRMANGDLAGDVIGLGIIQGENEQINQSEYALRYGLTSGIHNIISGIGFAFPDNSVGSIYFSTKFGGTHLGSILNAGAAFWNTLERNATHQAGRASTIGQYQRRQDEWVFQSRLALKEIQQVRQQIAAARIRQAIAENELTNHQKQIKNAEDADTFMREKYTNRELYSWMVNQIMGVYFQTYQLAYDVAKRAERAFRHELGLQDSNFVKFGYWDSLKKGLMVGDRLYNDLKRMEVAYLDQNKREYELTKHISLLQLNPLALVQLRETGRCFFDLPEEIFDLDYPGHYFRRIKSVSLTLPCVVGPYTTISCTLRLLKNSIRINTRINTANSDNGYRHNSDENNLLTDDARFSENIIPIKAIAASSAQNDSGLFELNFRDERYLPFEGAGVISGWSLELFNDETNQTDFGKSLRQFDYGTISDAILHIRYTAREEAGTFKKGAIDNLSKYFKQDVTTPAFRLFNLRQEFPTQWQRFLYPANAATGNVFELEMSSMLFPWRDNGKKIKINTLSLLARSTNKEADYTVVVTPPATNLPDLARTIILTSDSQFGELRHGVKSTTPEHPFEATIDLAASAQKWQFTMTGPNGNLEVDSKTKKMEVEDLILIFGYEWQ